MGPTAREALLQGPFRLCVVHNRPQRSSVDCSGLPFEVLEVDADPELCGDRSATQLRRAWLAGAGPEELSRLVGDLDAARLLCELREKGRQVVRFSLA